MHWRWAPARSSWDVPGCTAWLRPEAVVRHALRILGDDLALALALRGVRTLKQLRGKIDAD